MTTLDLKQVKGCAHEKKGLTLTIYSRSRTKAPHQGQAALPVGGIYRVAFYAVPVADSL